MPRTTAFWEERREAALQLARFTEGKSIVALTRVAGLRRKLRRLNQGIRTVSFSRRAWNRPYTKDLLVALISMERELVARYRLQHRKYEKRAHYCEAMIKRCQEKTLWDKVRQKSGF